MNEYAPCALSRAVAAICPDIQTQARRVVQPCERSLWWELSTCILSSQVPYPLAVSVANEVDAQELLLGEQQEIHVLHQKLFDIFVTPLHVEGCLRKYRFPQKRSRQLSNARQIVTKEYGTLTNFLESSLDAVEARAWLINHVPGIGPKQASMFLRNVGVSYELAILDRHVLKYMSALGIYSGKELFISNIKQYRRYEAVLKGHAEELDCSVGLLDWAIWIVMRVANRNAEVVAA
jgi:N-glycosylase/DNA lyase